MAQRQPEAGMRVAPTAMRAPEAVSDPQPARGVDRSRGPPASPEELRRSAAW